MVRCRGLGEGVALCASSATASHLLPATLQALDAPATDAPLDLGTEEAHHAVINDHRDVHTYGAGDAAEGKDKVTLHTCAVKQC